MNLTIKYILATLAGLIIGGLGVFVYAQGREMDLQKTNVLLTQENADLKIQKMDRVNQTGNIQQTTPFVTAKETLTPQKKGFGSIEGTLGYPAEGIPPLVVYAFQNGVTNKYFIVETNQNQTQFAIPSVEVGSYTVVAYPQGASTLAGGFTNAVSCGLTVSCTDHSLVIVEVKPGEITKGVEVRDWYAPDGTFPKKP